jgi:phytoene dehydrogenase-like protein
MGMLNIASSAWSAPNYDVIVVGAGYGGLICGAILAKNSLKTLIIDKLNTVGGKGGSLEYQGYWLDWGHRDGHDTGDTFMVMTAPAFYGKKAAEAAGADIKLVGPINPSLKVHFLPEGKVLSMSMEAEHMPAFVGGALEVPSDLIPKFLKIMAGLFGEDPQKWMAVTFKEWLSDIEEAPIRQGFMQMASIMFSLPPEETSVGRFIQFLRTPGYSFRANDPEVGGMQGFMEPYARVIRNLGGEFRMGVEILEILIADNRVKGIVVADASCAIQEFHAPLVICNLPIWDVFRLINEDYFPKEVVENAKRLDRYNGDMMTLNAGLSRLPTIRADNKPEDFAGWNRILRGPERAYGSGWVIPTLTSEKQAPKGKHLFHAAWGTGGPGCVGNEPFRSFSEAKAKVDTVLEYAYQYYKDLEDVIEWVTYNWHKAPTAVGYSWKNVQRAPLKAPTIEGLYFVGSSVEVDGFFQDIDAHSALEATELILKGH